jgi:hypothetical protein
MPMSLLIRLLLDTCCLEQATVGSLRAIPHPPPTLRLRFHACSISFRNPETHCLREDIDVWREGCYCVYFERKLAFN